MLDAVGKIVDTKYHHMVILQEKNDPTEKIITCVEHFGQQYFPRVTPYVA